MGLSRTKDEAKECLESSSDFAESDARKQLVVIGVGLAYILFFCSAPMHLYVAVTDKDWFALHASKPEVEEVNFWRPSPHATFKALQPGELLLFKLHSPDHFVAGGGFFTRFLQLPVNLVWDTFGEANGVRSQSEMRERIAYYRRSPIAANENPTIGCIMLAEPFFWNRADWIPSPPDFKLNTVTGKGYDSESGPGKELWKAVSERLAQSSAAVEPGTATVAAIETHGFGKPQIILPRLGQGLFRILVTDAYSRRCAITGERTLPVLEAAHIKPYSLVKRHELRNGLLMRSDLHTLFDEGYLTVDPKRRSVLVSKRIREEFENGKDYYKLQGQVVREPDEASARPLLENLEYHAQNVFR
jgi:putative restriction endonuclease